MTAILTVEEISKMDCGWFHTPFEKLLSACEPRLFDILETAPLKYEQWGDYVADVKVHMLMPNQYPCIPNWHFDNVPRDAAGVQDFSKVDTTHKMYLWVSGEPLTEFANGIKIKPQEWVEFTQRDSHRGTMSTIHTWRLFIRLCPKDILPPAPPERWKRKHTQVYLDASNFKW